MSVQTIIVQPRRSLRAKLTLEEQQEAVSTEKFNKICKYVFGGKIIFSRNWFVASHRGCRVTVAVFYIILSVA